MERYKFIATVMAALWCCLAVNAQSVSEIKDSDDYLYGEGWSEDFKTADREALADLSSKISMNIDFGIENITEEIKGTSGTVDYRKACKMVVNTYSQSTLQNTHRIVVRNEPDAHVFRYVKRSDVDKIFESRRLKVYDMVGSASRAVEKGKLDDALRYYYWGYCLLQSIPGANSVVDDAGHVLTHWIPEQINEVFDGLTVYKVSEQDGVAEIRVLYKGQPVTSLDYTYFDGMDWSNLYGAKDGRGFVELRPGITTDNLKIKCEYEYGGEAHIDKEISNVVNVMKGRTFRNAYIAVESSAPSAPAAMSQTLSIASNLQAGKVEASHLMTAYNKNAQPVNSEAKTLDKSITLLTESEAAPYNKKMEKVIAAIKSGNYASAQECFTVDGYKMYSQLISYGNARIMGESVLEYYKVGQEDVTCRSLPMSFSFQNNNRKFVEDVTFTFNKESKIDYLAFALDEKSTTDILKHDMWSEYARKILAEFLENYKTAYALKRLDYIRSIFDDNAVIITGKVVTRPAMGEMGGEYLNNKYVQYTRQGKEQYLRNLERCFDSNEYINIRFANNDIIKAGVGGEVYGIQIKQDYYSTNYGDTGYLFLMVDLNDPKKPVIKVRSWQPERDPNFGLIDLSHF